MYRIRFHGRGGQGMKTAGRILGSTFFLAGFEVQDAPRYGAERRGAPIFAYVRASKTPIFERGIITRPDLIIVADDHLPAIPGAGVLVGAGEQTVFLIHSNEKAALWKERLNLQGQVFTLPVLTDSELRFRGAACAGGAAALLEELNIDLLVEAVQEELAPLGSVLVEANCTIARAAYNALVEHRGAAHEGGPVSATEYTPPNWLTLPCDAPLLSAPAIHAPATSELTQTGLWRSEHPLIDTSRCNRCWWICSTFCPEGAIQVDAARRPHIDYAHCKGCMVCLAQCPTHAITAIPEEEAAAQGESP
ncbi:2-oxoacid:acceptor oxidoreductase family protein [Thiovibrio frasassiensis]|uniref:2-oxoacid:acceptor oxidoreductase family protein n=1 Tax=Thiovibrio frasassiensis TaxID=2984131 RepID=A0A9X4MES1_9BACT|nr:2-oxoacid:acceptor oxidoreductase family protein [Thiovibrio frasassiensis]MDG4476174.1 2-oxoacid:acceptor oxidoreductase family protein [Thiovibrio frasassiensis]